MHQGAIAVGPGKKSLRILAVARREWFADWSAVDGPESRINLGWDLDTPSPHPLALADPIPGDDEERDGTPVYWHPDVLLLRQPDLVGTVDRWRTGARRTINAEDWERLTYREIEAVLVMAGAQTREEARARANGNGADQGPAR